MTVLLFPGRHLLHTAFQEGYLRRIVRMPLDRLTFFDAPLPALPPLDQIVFAVTSSNQQHSRYNPIPLHVRALGVDRFARQLEPALGFTYRIVGIPHYRPTPRFAGHVLKEIAEQSEGTLELTPHNCVVLCSTPEVIALFRALGFAVLPAELGDPTAPPTPIEVVRRFVEAADDWPTDPWLRAHMHPTTLDLWQDFPDIPRRIARLWRDPLLNEAGDLTDTRDYTTYAVGMSNNAIIRVKYADVQPLIASGKIADEGCADGALLALVARDFPDSDLIGIEITGEFLARVQERQRAGEFGGSFIHFHQRNITQPIFRPNSIDTTLCNSTLHELWSYGDGEATVHAYLALKWAQTTAGGRLVIRDVVGPAAKQQTVSLFLRDDDGRSDDVAARPADPAAQRAWLTGLSTYGRFLRFAEDFLAEERASGRRPPETAVQFRHTALPDGFAAPFAGRLVETRLRDAAEFLSKMTYVDNWQSEMHEEFAFWDFDEWKEALAAAGFHVLENPNRPEQGSRVYLNSWLEENRYRGRVALYDRTADGRLLPRPYPVSNIVLVGEKPAPGDA